MNFNIRLDFQTGKNCFKQTNISEIHYRSERILQKSQSWGSALLSGTKKPEAVTWCCKISSSLPFKRSCISKSRKALEKVLKPHKQWQEARHVLQIQTGWKISLPLPSPFTSTPLLGSRSKMKSVGWSLKTAFRYKAEKNYLNDISLADWFSMRLQR